MFYITDKKEKIQIDIVKSLLGQSYWANQRCKDVIKKSIENSLCYGAYLKETDKQIAFARVITDYATTYYICDVIVDAEYRGLGIGKSLVDIIINDLRLAGLRGILATGDAHDLYEKFGFRTDNGRFMAKNP